MRLCMQKIILSLFALFTLPALAMEEEHPNNKQLTAVEQYEAHWSLAKKITYGEFTSALRLIDSGTVDVNADLSSMSENVHLTYLGYLSLDSFDNTPLGVAIRSNPSICTELLKRHARIDTKSKEGLPLLALAAIRSNPVLSPNAMKLYPTVLSYLITDSRFYPRCTQKEQEESMNRIWTALLCFKRYYPNMPKDLRKLFLFFNPDIRHDALNCPMGLCKELIHEMPLPALRTMIKKGLITKEHALDRLTNHKLACLMSLMNEARKFVSLDPVSYDSLNPELLKDRFAKDIRNEIDFHLGIKDSSWGSNIASNCSIQ